MTRRDYLFSQFVVVTEKRSRKRLIIRPPRSMFLLKLYIYKEIFYGESYYNKSTSCLFSYKSAKDARYNMYGVCDSCTSRGTITICTGKAVIYIFYLLVPVCVYFFFFFETKLRKILEIYRENVWTRQLLYGSCF